MSVKRSRMLLTKREKRLERFLETLPWPEILGSNTLYSRVHDDHDGEYEGEIRLSFSTDGDAWIETTGTRLGTPLRFRTPFGGTMSPRVRNALVILAFAIKMDNEERPIVQPPK